MARRKDGCFHNQENRGTSKRVPPQKHVGGTSSLTEPGEPYGDLTGKLGLDHWIAESPVGSDGGRESRVAPAEAVLRCATCHAESDAHRGMFGSDCGACHGTRGWMIPEYRHPSSTSSDCAQCHRAPPCHHTPHFKRVVRHSSWRAERRSPRLSFLPPRDRMEPHRGGRLVPEPLIG